MNKKGKNHVLYVVRARFVFFMSGGEESRAANFDSPGAFKVSVSRAAATEERERELVRRPLKSGKGGNEE